MAGECGSALRRRRSLRPKRNRFLDRQEMGRKQRPSTSRPKHACSRQKQEPSLWPWTTRTPESANWHSSRRKQASRVPRTERRPRMPTLTAAPIKVLKQLAADLDLEEAKLRREASALYAAAREAQAALTEGQKKRDDEIKDRLRAIAVDRIGNAEQLANEERLAELERTAQAAASAVTQVRESVADDPKRGFKNLGDFAMEILQCGPAPDAVRANPRLMAAA